MGKQANREQMNEPERDTQGSDTSGPRTAMQDLRHDTTAGIGVWRNGNEETCPLIVILTNCATIQSSFNHHPDGNSVWRGALVTHGAVSLATSGDLKLLVRNLWYAQDDAADARCGCPDKLAAGLLRALAGRI